MKQDNNLINNVWMCVMFFSLCSSCLICVDECSVYYTLPEYMSDVFNNSPRC